MIAMNRISECGNGDILLVFEPGDCYVCDEPMSADDEFRLLMHDNGNVCCQACATKVVLALDGTPDPPIRSLVCNVAMTWMNVIVFCAAFYVVVKWGTWFADWLTG